jgi:hypothetical protein
MHFYRRPQPPPRPLRQSLLETYFHHRDTEDTKDKKSADYTDFFQKRGNAGEPKGGWWWVPFSFASPLNQTKKKICVICVIRGSFTSVFSVPLW